MGDTVQKAGGKQQQAVSLALRIKKRKRGAASVIKEIRQVEKTEQRKRTEGNKKGKASVSRLETAGERAGGVLRRVPRSVLDVGCSRSGTLQSGMLLV